MDGMKRFSILDSTHRILKKAVREAIPKGPTFLDVFNKVAVEFCKFSTMHGLIHLVDKTKSSANKCMWFVVILIASIASIGCVLFAWDNFTITPTFTTLQDQQYPVWLVPFPAVSVCSANKISRSEAVKYANELVSKADYNVTFEEIYAKLRYLGHNLNFDTENTDELIAFQDFLDHIDGDPNTDRIDTRSIMKRLSPKCDDFMVYCKWRNEYYNCTDIVELRETYEGFCCTFNYVRQQFNIDDQTIDEPELSDAIGPMEGFIAVLNGTDDDYYYTSRQYQGFNIHVFNSISYPDISSSGFAQTIVSPGTEFFLRLDVSSVIAEPTISKYSIEQRKCLFSNELFDQFGGHYSYSECLIKCRIRSILALCGCIPYYLPTNFPDGTTHGTQCTLNDIVCLSRYKITWNTYRPTLSTGTVPGLERELEDSLNCPDCYPACSNVHYNIQSTSTPIPIDDEERPRWGLLARYENIKDLSVLRVYFPTVTSMMYKTDEVLTWYEIVSNFGGILSLFTGLSLISLIEFIYFFTIKLFSSFYKIKKRRNDKIIVPNGPHKIKVLSKNTRPSYKDVEMILAHATLPEGNAKHSRFNSIFSILHR